jgi:hypothetical protein
MKSLKTALVIAVSCLLTSGAVSAKVVKTKRTAHTANEVVVGSRIEVENQEYSLPVLIEWSPTKRLELSAEVAYGRVELDGSRVGGLQDLELAAVYELVSERRSRPSLSLEFGVKLPTASNSDLGTGKADYTLGAVLSKDFLRWDGQLAASYTFVGSPADENLSNVYEVAASAEWHPSERLDVFGEIVASHGGSGRGGFGIGGPTAIEGAGFETELTVGVAENLTSRFKLEQGVTFSSSSSIVYVLGWEYNFGSN